MTCSFIDTTIYSLHICIDQNNAISAAIITGIATLMAIFVKFRLDSKDRFARQQFDRNERLARESFEDQQRKAQSDFETKQIEEQSKLRKKIESSEREAREVFERAEREAREDFERAEREARNVYEKVARNDSEKFEDEQDTKRLDFESRQSEETANRQAALEKKLMEYAEQRKWCNARHERMLTRIEDATQRLEATYRGTVGLVEIGPAYDDIEMIRQSALVLEDFGKFKKSISHFTIDGDFKIQCRILEDHFMTMFLTLSPVQDVRQSDDRKKKLNELKTELDKQKLSFEDLCRKFEQSPQSFDSETS